MYSADFLRTFGAAGVDGLLLDEGPVPAGQLTDPEAYRPVLNVAEHYGWPVGRVRAIARIEKITPVPSAPIYYRGVISLRGQVLSVMDLRTYLGLPPLDRSGNEDPGLNGANVNARCVEHETVVVKPDPVRPGVAGGRVVGERQVEGVEQRVDRQQQKQPEGGHDERDREPAIGQEAEAPCRGRGDEPVGL